jgi:hypothetical protein
MSLFSGESSYEEHEYTIINTPSRLTKIMGNKSFFKLLNDKNVMDLFKSILDKNSIEEGVGT